MSFVDFIIILIAAVFVGILIYFKIKAAKRKGCSGCSACGKCKGCSGNCSSCDVNGDNLKP